MSDIRVLYVNKHGMYLGYLLNMGTLDVWPLVFKNCVLIDAIANYLVS